MSEEKKDKAVKADDAPKKEEPRPAPKKQGKPKPVKEAKPPSGELVRFSRYALMMYFGRDEKKAPRTPEQVAATLDSGEALFVARGPKGKGFVLTPKKEGSLYSLSDAAKQRGLLK